MKIRVDRFHLQPTWSFMNGAPQREEYEDDDSFFAACKEYSAEWCDRYECKDTKCNNRDCPQHFPLS